MLETRSKPQNGVAILRDRRDHKETLETHSRRGTPGRFKITVTSGREIGSMACIAMRRFNQAFDLRLSQINLRHIVGKRRVLGLFMLRRFLGDWDD